MKVTTYKTGAELLDAVTKLSDVKFTAYFNTPKYGDFSLVSGEGK